MESLVKDKITYARTQSETYKNVILLFEEARTRRQIGDAVVGSILGGKKLPPESHEDAEEQYWKVLENYLLIAQALEDPTLVKKSQATSEDHQTMMTMGKSKLDKDDPFRVTSYFAIQNIRHRPSEYEQAKKDLTKLWNKHRITDEEREYENTIDELLITKQIEECGYWYCCPFPSAYKVIRGPIEIIGHKIPTDYEFVWNYREGRLISSASFTQANGRHYCESDHGNNHSGSHHQC